MNVQVCGLLSRLQSVHCSPHFPFAALVQKNGLTQFWDIPWETDPGRPMLQVLVCSLVESLGDLACMLGMILPSVWIVAR